ncbi:uncharacterized protein UHOD_11056 [Ustilago sp. UG-2017b]|nr:uncharacterized protein UHOD_11056 [Ustilago sp. UG-2017b]
MTTTTDDSLDISAQLFWKSATPTSSATQTRNIPHALLPSQELIKSNPGNKLRKHPIFWEIFKLIFPGAPVEPNHIKAKLRWVQETYYKEKKKLSLTGAGTLLEDMDASNPSYASCLALSTKYTWFEKMHEMMNGRSSAKPATLITTPSLNFTSDYKAGMPPYGSAEIPMDLSGSEPYDHGTHGHGLPPILDLMDSTNPPAAIASTSGASIAGAGDDDIFTTPFPSQARPSFSTAGGLDVFESSSSPSSAPLSPSTKHKRGALDHKHDTLAEAFYRLSGVSRLNPVGLSGYSVTIKLCDSYCLSIGLDELRRSAAIKLRNDSRWCSLYMLSQGSADLWGHSVQGDPRTAVDYCLRFYLNPDRWSAMNRLRTSLYAMSAPSDTAPPPQDLLAGLLYTAPPPSTGDSSFDSCLSSPWVECTRRERMLEAEHTKHEEMRMQHKREEKERNEHVCVHDRDMVMEMVHLLASQASGEQDARQNTSNNNNTDSSFNLPAL